MKREKVGISIMLMMIATFIAKLFGFVREVLVAQYYGTSIYTDAYIIANNIPTVFFAAIDAAIVTTFIPMYSKIVSERDEERANLYTRHLLVVLIVMSAIATIFGEIFIKKVVFLFASGFEGKVFDLTVSFTRILFPTILGMTMFGVFGCYLQNYRKFTILAIVPIIGNLVIILSLIISNVFSNVYIFVWGTFFGLMAQVLFYLPKVAECGLFKGNWKGITSDHYLKEWLPLLIPVLIGTAATEINSMIDKTLVSGLETGSVSALNYAYKVIGLVIGVVVASFINIVYPEMAVSANEDEKKFIIVCTNTVKSVVAYIVPISLLIIFLRNSIVSILFERGIFDSESVRKTSASLAFYAIGLPAMGLRDIQVRMYYCKQNTRTPMINGLLCTGGNIILDLILIRVMQYKGAAFATAITAIIGAILLFISLSHDGYINIKDIQGSFIKTFLSGLTASFLIFAMEKRIVFRIGGTISKIIECCVIAVIYIVVYLCVQIAFKNEAVYVALNGIIKKIHSK